MSIRLDDLRAALTLPDFDVLGAQSAMLPESRRYFPQEKTAKTRQAGVLVLIFPEDKMLHFVLTRRTETLRGHRGQVSFPGGQRDLVDASITDTALRETCEELGICDAGFEIVGSLSPIYIPPSDFEVFPVVAILAARPHFRPNPAEVAEVFTVPLAALLDGRYKLEEMRDFNDLRVLVPYYGFNGHKVWGATAIMLSELEGRLRAVLPDDVLAAWG
jgi:8-oxo-dGTP pyrophosphatase MutT (NUDIX family)